MTSPTQVSSQFDSIGHADPAATLPCYEVYAIRYATRTARRASYFIGGDPHDSAQVMDYFVWLVRSPQLVLVVDTGFCEPVAGQRGRTLLRHPVEGLKLMGVDATAVRDVVITHLHYDHAGTHHCFPKACFHLQDDEMAYATGRQMRHAQFNHGYEVEEVIGMVRMVYEDRVRFHRGDAVLTPGLSLHRLGGHTHGLQCVRVHTARGWVVLASDSSHFYEHFEGRRFFPTMFHLGEAADGYRRITELASSPRHVIPGHDPLVMQRYPSAGQGLDGIIARLDVNPTE